MGAPNLSLKTLSPIRFCRKARKVWSKRSWEAGLQPCSNQGPAGMDPVFVGPETYTIWRATLRKIIRNHQKKPHKNQSRVPWVTWLASQCLCLGAHIPPFSLLGGDDQTGRGSFVLSHQGVDIKPKNHKEIGLLEVWHLIPIHDL